MDVKKRLLRAKVQLMLKHPFFGYLISFLKFIWDESVPTIAVNPDGVVKLNPKYVEKLSDGELEGCFSHEVLHVALEHFERQGCRDKQLWNIATDIAINEMLSKSGFKLPSGALFYHKVERWKEELEELKSKLKAMGIPFKELSK